MVWPQRIIARFSSVCDTSTEAAFHGPYNKLLTYLFPLDDEQDYTIEPQFSVPGTRDSEQINFAFTFQILLENKPIFFIELRPPGNLQYLSRRSEADGQICDRLADLLPLNTMPRVQGVSAFGTKLCFYSVDRATGVITPAPVERDRRFVTDIAPEERWCYDVLEQAGEAKLREVIAEIKAWCAMQA